MTTAVDTNILLDLLIPDPRWEQSSQDAMAKALDEGDVIVGEAVFAELAAQFDSAVRAQTFLADLGTTYVQSSKTALFRAGTAWRRYAMRRPKSVACAHCGARIEMRCAQCREPVAMRQHLIADFMVGAHALTHADRLLTRDLGYYGVYFPELTLV